jgi:Protein of unknown function (DUF4230)
MIRWIGRLLLGLLLLAGGAWVWEKFQVINPFRNETHTMQQSVLKEVVLMGKLQLVKYHFRDVVEHEIVKPLLPNAKALLIVAGEVVGCVDLVKMNAQDIVIQGDTVVATLPAPEICVQKIDHSQSKLYNTQFAFFEEGQLVDAAYRQAEAQLQKSAQALQIEQQTESAAGQVLRPLLERLTQRPVKIRFHAGSVK